MAEAAINATAHRGKYASALDAGCGTGLAGLPSCATPWKDIDVDLSSKWPEYAAELCSTDDGKIERADAATRKATELGDGLPPRRDGQPAAARDDCELDAQYELVVSADVLCYFGDLRDVLGALAAKTAPGGDPHLHRRDLRGNQPGS